MKRHTKIRGVARYIPLPWDGSSFTSALLMCLSVVLIVLSAIKPNSLSGVRSLISDLFAPTLSIFSLPLQRSTMVIHDITSIAQIQADKARLEQENARLREWYQTALLLESENKSLRALLNLEVDPKYNHISGRIISDSGNAFVKSILVAAGKNKNIRKGAAVLSGEGLIGRVVEVSEKTSRVLLVTDINSRVPVVLEGTDQNLIMAGSNNDLPRLIHLPQDSEINENARLYTSGYGGVYPVGMPVGRVIKQETGILNVMLFADFNSLQIVRIIQKQEQD